MAAKRKDGKALDEVLDEVLDDLKKEDTTHGEGGDEVPVVEGELIGSDEGDRRSDEDAEHEIVHKGERFPRNLFIIPLKNFVIFPGLVMPIQLSNPKALETLKQARSQSEYLGFLALEDPDREPEVGADLFTVGTMVKVVKTINMPGDEVNVPGPGDATLSGGQVPPGEALLHRQGSSTSKRWWTRTTRPWL